MPSQKLRILFLVLEMDLGGLQRMVNQLIQKMDRTVFEPYICCLDRGGIFYDQTATNCAGAFILGRKPGPFDGKLFGQLYSILKEYKIDIIHSHNGCSSYAALAGKLARVKRIIHTDHGRLVPDKMSAKLEDRLFSRMMDTFVGVSTELTAYLASTVKISKTKLATIINGVDTETFRPVTADERRSLRSRIGIADNEKIIGTVCRLDPIKNLEFMITCMPSIVKKIPEAKLVIVGDGPASDALKQLVVELQLNHFVSFLGQKTNIENILPAFDVYACSSLSEGTSMTILEAMSCGLPIIASAVGGNVRLVSNLNGNLYPLNNKSLFIDGIDTLLRDPVERVQKGIMSRDMVERGFSLRRMVQEYERLYMSVA